MAAMLKLRFKGKRHKTNSKIMPWFGVQKAIPKHAELWCLAQSYIYFLVELELECEHASSPLSTVTTWPYILIWFLFQFHCASTVCRISAIIAVSVKKRKAPCLHYLQEGSLSPTQSQFNKRTNASDRTTVGFLSQYGISVRFLMKGSWRD